MQERRFLLGQPEPPEMQRIAIRVETRSQGNEFFRSLWQRCVANIGPNCSVVRLRESHGHWGWVEAFIVFLSRKRIFDHDVNSPEFVTPPRHTGGRPGFIFKGRRKERVLVMLCPCVAIGTLGQTAGAMKARAPQ